MHCCCYFLGGNSLCYLPAHNSFTYLKYIELAGSPKRWTFVNFFRHRRRIMSRPLNFFIETLLITEVS